MWLRPEKRATGAVSSQTGRLNRSRSQSLMAREGQKMFMNMQRHGESERLTGQTKGSHTLKALHSGLHLEVRYHPFSFLFLSFLVVVVVVDVALRWSRLQRWDDMELNISKPCVSIHFSAQLSRTHRIRSFTFIICHYFMILWFHFVRQVKLLGVAGMSVAHENHIESWDVCSAWDFFRVCSVHDAVHIRYPTYPTAVSCHRRTQDTGWHRPHRMLSVVQCCPVLSRLADMTFPGILAGEKATDRYRLWASWALRYKICWHFCIFGLLLRVTADITIPFLTSFSCNRMFVCCLESVSVC